MFYTQYTMLLLSVKSSKISTRYHQVAKWSKFTLYALCTRQEHIFQFVISKATQIKSKGICINDISH